MNMFDYLLNNFQCKTAANKFKETDTDRKLKLIGAGSGALAGSAANTLAVSKVFPISEILKEKRKSAKDILYAHELEPEELRDATRRFERAAKGNGYIESIPGSNNRVFRNPKTRKVIGLSSVSAGPGGPHMQPLDVLPKDMAKRIAENEFPYQKVLPDKIVRLISYKNLRDDATIAHEVGHSLQGKKFMTAAALMRNSAPIAVGGMLFNTRVSKNKTEKALKNERTRDRVLAGLGTAGSGVTLANELHASYAGSKYLGSWKNRIKAFNGVPSYAAMAAIPGLTYAGKYVAGPYLKEKYNQFVSKKK